MFRDKKKKGKNDKPEETKKTSGELNIDLSAKEPKLSPRLDKDTSPRVDSPKKEKKGLFGLFKSKSNLGESPDKPSKGDSKEENENENENEDKENDSGAKQVTIREEPTDVVITSGVSTASTLEEDLSSTQTDDGSLSSLQEEDSLSSLKSEARGVSIDRREELRKKNTSGRKKLNNATVVGKGRTIKFAPQPEEVPEKPEDYEDIFLDFERRNMVSNVGDAVVCVTGADMIDSFLHLVGYYTKEEECCQDKSQGLAKRAV